MILPKVVMPVLLVACGISLACAQKDGPTQPTHTDSTYVPLAAAPQAARSRTNPLEGNSREAAAGGKLFEQHCAECHGPNATGTMRAPSLVHAEVRQAAPGALFWILTNGVVRHGMPVWSKLPEPERWQIVTFLRSINARRTMPDAQ